jgi:hypothetical protein
MDKKWKQQLKKDYQGKSMLSKANWDEDFEDPYYEEDILEKKKKPKKTWKDKDSKSEKNYRDFS